MSGFMLSENTIPLHKLIIQLAVVTFAALVAFWYYLLFIKYRAVYLGIMEMSLRGNFGQGKICYT